MASPSASSSRKRFVRRITAAASPITFGIVSASFCAVASCSSDDASAEPWTTPADAGDSDSADASVESSLPDSSTGDGSTQTCVPRTCSQLGASCGATPDGCGGKLHCGDCPAGLVCGGGGPNVCGSSSCAPKTCSQLGASCGTLSDGCSQVLECGSCTAPETCGGAGVANQCGCSCSLPHADAVCSASGCAIAACNDGFSDCNAQDADGCEVDLSSNADHCGACGHVCGEVACGGKQSCVSGACAGGPALPSGWPASLSLWDWNPVLVPTSGHPNHGADNVYAPDIHEVDGVQVMFYGAQGADGHDRVYLAWSREGLDWRKYPTDSAPAPVLDHGGSNHVNDPSVVRAGATWRMYYTDAPTAENDRIWLAEATNLRSFQKSAEVLGPVPGTWEADKVGRPSVLLEGGKYKMWYDGAANGQRHVGFASSDDGVHFTRHVGNPIFLNAGAIDVKKVGDQYVMLREGGDGTYWATSPDGLCWVDRGKLFGKSGKAYDAYGQVTPFLQVSSGVLRGIWFGGASVATWNKNRIAVAFPAGASVPSAGGCTGCTTDGWSCSQACQSAGGGALGTCGAPGSTSPGACCACQSEGCEGCQPHVDCQAACVAAGKAGGWCATPGSQDPDHCCACLP